MQGVDEQENVPKNPRSRKRSSILKMPPIPRSPLKDRNKEEKSRRSSRRVSFADKHQIKEFHAESSTLTVQNNEERIVINSLDLRLSNIINDGLKLCENQLNEDSEATQGLDISLSKSESDVFESLSAEEPSIHVSVRRGSKKRKSTYEETEYAKAIKLNEPESTIIQEMTLTEDRMDLTLAYAGLIEKSSTSHCDVTICKTLDMNLTALSPQNDCDAIESYQSNKNNIYEYLSKETDISENNRTLLLEESLNLTCTDPQSSSADENSEESSEERNTKTDGAFENPVEASCKEQATKVEGEENSSTEKLASRYQQDSKNEELCPTNQLLIKSTSNETLKIDKCKTSNENVDLNSSQKKLICQMDMKENVVFKKTVIDDLNAFELDSNNKMASYQSYKNSTRDLEKTHIFNNDENALEETQYLNTSIQLLNENFECKLKVDLAKSEIGEQKHDNRKQSLCSKKCLPQNKADINDILMTTKDNYGSCFPKGDTIIFPNSLSSDMEETCYSSNVTKNVVAEEKENLPFKNKFCSQKQDKTIVFENSHSDDMEETCYSSSATRNIVIEEKENLPFQNKFCSQKKDKTIVFENSLSDYMEETCYSSSLTRNVVIEEKENLPFKNKFSQKKDKTIVFENSLSDDMEETCHFSNATRNIVIEEKENLPLKSKFCFQKKDKTIVFENSLSDDMEETCHFSNATRNIVIEEKENLPIKNKFCSQKKDKTIVFENSLCDDMEETCHFSNATRNIVIEEKENLPLKSKFCFQKKDKTIVFENSLSDDMEETCHFSNATRNIVIEEKENLPIKNKFCSQKKDKTIVFENSLCDDMEETCYSSNATRNVMVEKKENFPIKNKFCFQEGDKTIVFENSLSDDMEETCYSSTLTKRNNVAAEEKENFPIKNDLLEASLINTKKLNCFQKGDKTVVFQNTFSEIMEETCHPATTINDTEVSEKENPHDKFTKVSEMNTEGFIASLQRASKTIIFGQSFSDDMEETCHPINVTTNILANKSQKLQNKSAFGDISFLQREKKESCSKERNKTIIFENTVSNDMEETCYPITLNSNPDYNVKKDQCYPHNFDDISLMKKKHNTHTLKENKTIFFEKSFADDMEETCFTSGNRTTTETDDQSIANHSTFKSSILNKSKGQGASAVLSNIFNLSKTNSEFVYNKPNSGIKSTQIEIRNSKTVSEAQPFQSDITVPSVQEISYSNKSRSILENDGNSFLLKSKNFDSVLNKNKGESASQVLSNIFSLSKTKSEFSYSKSDRDAKSTASQPEIHNGSESKTCHSDDVDKIIDQNISSGALNKSMPLSLDNRQLLPKIIVTSDNFINTKEEKSEIMSSRKKSETPKIEVQHNRTSNNFPNNSDFVNKTLSTSQQNCNPDAQLIMSVNSQLSKTERETQKLHSEDKSKYYANEDERDLKMPDEENRFGSSGDQLLLQSNFTNKDKIKLDSSQQNILHQTNSHNESNMMNIIKKDLSGREEQLSFNHIDPFMQNNGKGNDKCFENEVLGIKAADVHEEDSRSNRFKSDIEQTSAEQKSSKSLVNEDITKSRSNNVSNTESLDVMDQKEEDCIQNEQCISFNTNIQLPEKDPRSERVEEHNSDNTCIDEDQPNLGNQQYDIPFNKHEGVISSHSSMNHSSVSNEMLLQNLQHDNVSPQKTTKEFSSSKEVNYKVSEDETSFNLNISCKQMKKSDIQIDEFEVEMQELSTINNESKHQMSKSNIAEHDVSSSNLKQCNKSDNISVVEDTMQKTSEVQTEDYKTDLGECVDCFETVSLESVTGQKKSSLNISASNALQMMEQPCSLSKSSLNISTSNALQMMEQPCSLSKSSLNISTSNALQMTEQPCNLSHKSSLPSKDISSIDTVTSNQSCRNKLKLENNKEDPISTIPDNSMMNGLSCTFAEKQLFNTSGLPKQEGTSDEDMNLKTCVTDTSNSIQLKGFDSDAKCLDVSSLKITSNIHEGKDFSDNSVQKSQSLLKRSNDIDDKMVCLQKQNFQGTDFGNEAKRCKLDKTNQVDDDHENLNEVSKLNFDVPITSEGDGREFLITNAYKISTASEEKELCISEDVNLSSHNTLKTNIKHNEYNRDFADQKTLSDEIESKSSNFQNEEQFEVNNHCLDLVEVKTPNKNIDSKEHTNSFANISLSQNINQPSGDDNLKNEANHAKSKELDKSHNEILNIEGGCKLDTSHKSECRANNTDLSFKHVHNPENSIKIEEESLVQFKRMEESESLKMKSTSSYRSEIEKVDKIRHSIKKSTKPFAAAGEKNNFPLELTLKHDVQTPFAKKENLVSQKTPKVSSVDGTPSCTVKIGMNNLSSKKSQCTGKIHDVNSNNSSNAYSKTVSSQMNELGDDIELITDVQFPDITSELYLSNCSKTNVLEPSPLISPSKYNQSHLKINTGRNYIDHRFETPKSQPTNMTNIIQSTISKASTSNVDLKSLNSAHILNSTRDNSYESLMGTNFKISERSDTSKLNVTLSSKTQTTIQSESSMKKAAMEFSNVNCSKDLPIPERNFNSCDSEVPKMQPLSYSVQSNKDSICVKSSIETELVSLQKLIAVEDESVDLLKNPPSARILMLVTDLYRLNDGVQKEAIRVSESASMEVQSYQAEVLRETVKKKEDEISELKKQKEDLSIKISELKLKEEKLRKEKSEAETNLEKEKKQSQNAVKECADLRDYLHVVEKYAGWHIEDFSETNLTLLLFCETLSLNIVFESPFLSTESSKILDMKLTAIKNPSSTIGTLAHHLIVNAFESLRTTKPCETSLGLPQFINTFTLLICDVTNLVSDLNLINIGHKLSVQNDRIVVQFHSVKAETIFNIHFIFTKIEQFPGFSVNTCHELELGNNWEKEILNGCKLHQLDRLRCFHDIVEHVDRYFLEKYYS